MALDASKIEDSPVDVSFLRSKKTKSKLRSEQKKIYGDHSDNPTEAGRSAKLKKPHPNTKQAKARGISDNHPSNSEHEDLERSTKPEGQVGQRKDDFAKNFLQFLIEKNISNQELRLAIFFLHECLALKANEFEFSNMEISAATKIDISRIPAITKNLESSGAISKLQSSGGRQKNKYSIYLQYS